MVSFILVRPQMGENIGAAARVMANFALNELRIVAPRDGWPNPAAIAMAAGGLDVLEAARCIDTVREAVADMQCVYATTARGRDMAKEAIASPQLPAHMARYGANRRIGILFGPERSGLENEDLACADTLVSVPVNPAYPSLNLAQAVALIAYELSRGEAPPPHQAVTGDGVADKQTLHGLFDQLETELDARNFWRVAEKKPQMWLNIRNFLQRGQPSEQEIRTLRGLIRCLSER